MPLMAHNQRVNIWPDLELLLNFLYKLEDNVRSIWINPWSKWSLTFQDGYPRWILFQRCRVCLRRWTFK